MKNLVKGSRRRQAALAATLAVLVLPVGAPALAADADPHAHHHHQASAKTSSGTTKINQVSVNIPALSLVRSDGKAVDLASELADARPVLLNFVFTTCTAICPAMSQVFSAVQTELGAQRSKVHMVSISIDPEHDTPERLAAYAKRFEAGAQWQFYTGTANASVAVQRAFDTYRGDKMNHESRTFLRPAPGKAWVRIDGLASPSQLAQQLRTALATSQ